MSWVAVAIGGGAALLKNYAVDQPAADRKRKLAGETQRMSPWTGLKADAVQDPNVVGSLMSGATAGAQFGAGMQNAEAQKGLVGAQTSWLNNNPYSSAPAANSVMGKLNYGQGSSANPWSFFGTQKPSSLF